MNEWMNEDLLLLQQRFVFIMTMLAVEMMVIAGANADQDIDNDDIAYRYIWYCL